MPWCGLLLVWLLLRGQLVTCLSDVLIEETGLLPWDITDTALTIYLTVVHVGAFPINGVTVDAHRCCLELGLPEKDRDCRVFHALGESTELLMPKHEHNFTLILPMLYPYDRVGECTVEITCEQTTHIQHTVYFDTRLIGENIHNLPPSVRDIARLVSPCRYPDHDPLRACLPVDCNLKYGNKRSFYNRHTMRCERAAMCPTSDNKPLAFAPDSNACKDQDLYLDKYHTSGLEHSVARIWEPFDMLRVYPILCVHGRRSEVGCICESGWMTSTEGHSAFDVVDGVFKLCNTQTRDYLDAIQPTAAIVALIVICALSLVMLGVLLVMYFRSKARRSSTRLSIINRNYENRPPQKGTVFAMARVHTPNSPLEDDELELRIGDVLTDLRRTSNKGVWIGSCRTHRGKFPVACVQFYMPNDVPTSDMDISINKMAS